MTPELKARILKTRYQPTTVGNMMIDPEGGYCSFEAVEILRAENEALKQQVEQGKRDAERLDYLQQGVTIDLWGKALLFRVGGIYSTLNKSIREAIDAAIAAAPKQEK